MRADLFVRVFLTSMSRENLKEYAKVFFELSKLE